MPLSVLFAIVLMYFTGITFNILSLSGLALGVGMLVDNSVVVIENIYRLRGRGVPAARAAVQGARQVGMSVVASTLTSVCVFLPVVFASGTVRSLLQPMSMCIGYCLMASLIVAITVVPAAASTVLKKAEPKRLVWFEKIQDKYAHSLEWCLQHRALPLLAAVVLLAFCGWKVFSMGVVLLPEISSNEATIALSTDDGLTKEESYGVAGQVVEAVMAVDGVEEVGVTTDTTVAGIDIGQLGLPSAITDLLNAATGTNWTIEQVLEIGDRIYNIERMFNKAAGMKPEDDRLPKRLLEEPVVNGPSTGMTSKLPLTLPEYYEARGWVNAFPTDETLKKLGLDECVGK